MTDQDYELLSQYLDGELDSGEAHALKQRLLAEPALRGEFESMKRADLRLRTALQSDTASRIPQRVQAMLADDAAGSRDRRAGWGFALAASVLVASGVLVTAWDGGSEPRGAQLAAVLENAPSRGEGWDRLDSGERVRAVLSFRGADGNWCREYLAAGENGAERGVACRIEGNWEVMVSTTVALSAGSADYRPAGAADADPIAGFIDNQAADIPLGVEQEAALIERAWR
jgi:hypothetical protein